MSRGVSLIAILHIDTEGLPFVINYFVYVCKEVMRILVRGIKRQITPTGKGRDSIQKYKIWRQRSELKMVFTFWQILIFKVRI